MRQSAPKPARPPSLNPEVTSPQALIRIAYYYYYYREVGCHIKQ